MEYRPAKFFHRYIYIYIYKKTFVTFVIPRECLKSETVDQLSVAEIVGGALFTRFFHSDIVY